MAEPLLAGTTVILTGAAGGIGRHVAAALGAAGARVAVTDLEAEGLDPVVQQLENVGTRVTAEAFDGADPVRFATFHARVRNELGEVDGLVACAGRWQPVPF